jgi:hypothetical protein
MVEPAAISAIIVSILTAVSGLALGLHFKFNTHCWSCCADSECYGDSERRSSVAPPAAAATAPRTVQFATTHEVRQYEV